MPDTVGTTGRSSKTAPQEPLRAKGGALRRAIATVVAILLGVTVESFQTPPIRTVAASLLREYTGVYEWAPDSFVYLQMWEELTGFGKPALVAFDQSGWVRFSPPSTSGSPAAFADRSSGDSFRRAASIYSVGSHALNGLGIAATSGGRRRG